MLDHTFECFDPAEPDDPAVPDVIDHAGWVSDHRPEYLTVHYMDGRTHPVRVR